MTSGMFYLLLTSGLLIYLACATVLLVRSIIEYRKAKREASLKVENDRIQGRIALYQAGRH